LFDWLQEAAMEEKTAVITGLVPFLPVRNVERSVAFYQLLGFEVGKRVPREGAMGWAWLYTPEAPDWRRGANLMLSCADREGDVDSPGTLYYLYAADLVSLREKLIAADLKPGSITYPDYLPKGEFRIQDPDGHTLMLAQHNTDTP
jgi:catechol 2,3-dioxygenase-like lactoylglutathione lyase family enzyme